MLGRASVISHETSHMWFGDLVTMKWFNDVWMKEVFANFMAAKIVNPSFPEVNHELRFLYQYYPGVRRRSHRGRQSDPADARESERGGVALRRDHLSEGADRHAAARALVGADTFRDGLREYLKAHSFGNATWTDLIALLDAKTPENLAAWSQPGSRRPDGPRSRPRSRSPINTSIDLPFVRAIREGARLSGPSACR
jgi:aminopeptidase N